MNLYALALTAIGITIASQSKTDGTRALGSVLAGVAGGVLLRPHISAVGDPTPPPQIVR